MQGKRGFIYHHTNDIVWKLMGDIRTEHVTDTEVRNLIDWIVVQSNL